MILPTKIRKVLYETGEIANFTGRFFSQEFKPHFEFKEFIWQCYIIGYKSLPLVGLTGFIMGLVITLQLRPTLMKYGIQYELPVLVSTAIIREIGPAITALIFAGKIGSSIGAELASMKVTEQIDAMEVSGTNPFKYLVVTRVLATTFMLPLLVILSNTISLFGAYLGINLHSFTTGFSLFFSQVFNNLNFSDVLPAYIKTYFFGFAVGLIGCLKGFYSSKGTEGVGISANSAVVTSSILIFIIDLIAVQLTGI